MSTYKHMPKAEGFLIASDYFAAFTKPTAALVFREVLRRCDTGNRAMVVWKTLAKEQGLDLKSVYEAISHLTHHGILAKDPESAHVYVVNPEFVWKGLLTDAWDKALEEFHVLHEISCQRIEARRNA